MRKPKASSFVDSSAARLTALFVFAICVAALAWLHRGDLLPADKAEGTAVLNPEFVAFMEANVVQ